MKLCQVCVLLLAPAALAAPVADLILHNGKVITVDGKFSIQRAVAVKDGKILAVGDDKSVLARRGPATEAIDLKGRAVLPGLIDAHVHVLSSAVSEYRKPLSPLNSYAAVQAYIRERAAATPKGQWIVVPRTFPTRLKELSMPTREVLDVATEHPVMFDASYVWIVNSYALRMSGITRATPNPPGGEIVKDANGEPNGILRNAGKLLKGLGNRDEFSNLTESERLDAMERMLKRYLAAGLTSIGDRAVTQEDIALYGKLKAAGRLPIRVVLTWRIDSSRPLDQIEREIRSAPFTTGTGDERLKFGTFKVTLDGGMTIGTAYQRFPYGPFGAQLYRHVKPDDRGQLFVAPDKLTAIFRVARDKGWQLTAHSQGGGAVDVMLDAFEALDRERPIAPTRSHLMHASFQSPEAIARMKPLGVLADVQAAWLNLDAPALDKVFRRDGLRYFFPLRSYLNAGIVVAGGSDHMIGFDKNTAVNPYNPFHGLWVSVTRRTDRGDVIWPDQKVTREEALKMYTTGAAYMQFSEKVKGSIEPGKLADLVVIDRDYLTCPEDEIRAIEPLLTILEGKIVYRR